MPTSPHPARRLGLTLLAVALLSAPLAACGNSNDQASPPPTTTSTAPTSEPTPSIDREARLERLKTVFAGYLNAFVQGTATNNVYESDALMREWTTEKRIGLLRKDFAKYRDKQQVMTKAEQFTAHLSPDPTIMYACMDLVPSMAKSKVTGEEHRAYDRDRETWIVSFTETNADKWLVLFVNEGNQEAKKQCGM